MFTSITAVVQAAMSLLATVSYLTDLERAGDAAQLAAICLLYLSMVKTAIDTTATVLSLCTTAGRLLMRRAQRSGSTGPAVLAVPDSNTTIRQNFDFSFATSPTFEQQDLLVSDDSFDEYARPPTPPLPNQQLHTMVVGEDLVRVDTNHDTLRYVERPQMNAAQAESHALAGIDSMMATLERNCDPFEVFATSRSSPLHSELYRTLPALSSHTNPSLSNLNFTFDSDVAAVHRRRFEEI